jgi:hypothetical protein
MQGKNGLGDAALAGTVRFDQQLLKLHVPHLPRQNSQLVAGYVEFLDARQTGV